MTATRLTAERVWPFFAKLVSFARFYLTCYFNCLRFCEYCLRNWGLKMTVWGYARVSTQDQDLSGQLETLNAAGTTKVYREKVSGVRAQRPQLAKLMASLMPGDVVVVTKLDRLGGRPGNCSN